MLEVRNLTKIYKDKGGTEVRALDDVSVKLGDTGLVFILGKSGCGKSTFLNIVGGLDTPTSGEVIVNGKSSKDFSQADFDSYRNTFIGFVFQEYNVLNEFSVEDNVALALNLQKQKQVKDKVMEILKEVELDKYAKRKPNTLSGGQKQRIAIARALVKDPQIIMADEPTGALDSNTGRQVLDTLKHLSKTRLVIVVSHDRESAMQYGDRIIELADGRVISDVVKIFESPTQLPGNVQQIGNEILSIEKGTLLTQQNLLTIQQFISSHNGVMIVSGDTEIANTKKANRISDNNSRETFKETDKTGYGTYLNNAKPTKGSGELIKSKLPMGKAIKMGLSSLKGHPFRLFLTILLSVIAFIVFGILTCFMTYNGTTVAASTFADGNENYLTLTKSYTSDPMYNSNGELYYNYYNTKFSPDDSEKYFGIDSDDVLFGSYAWMNFNGLELDSSNSETQGLYYNNLNINKVVYIPEENTLRNEIYGTYPKNGNEICIGSYLADYMMHCNVRAYKYDEDAGGYTNDDPIQPKSEEELIGLTLETYGGAYLTITGIVNTGGLPSTYDYLKTETEYNQDYEIMRYYLEDGLDCSVFVTEDFVLNPDSYIYNNSNIDPSNYFNYARNIYIYVSGTDNDSAYAYYINTYNENRVMNLDSVFVDGREDHTLKDNELILSLDRIGALIPGQYQKKYDEFCEQHSESDSDIMQEFQQTDFYQDYNNIYYVISDYINGRSYYGHYATDSDGEDTGEQGTDEVELTEDDYAVMDEMICSYLTKYPLELDVYQYDEYGDMQAVEDGALFTIAGYFWYGGDVSSAIYVSDSDYNTSIATESYYWSDSSTKISYVVPDDAMYEYMIIPIQHNLTWMNSLLNKLYIVNSDFTYYELNNNIYSSIQYANNMVETFSTIFLIVGLVFAVFSALLLFNFISVSIGNKKKEIGILRAVGAKSGDVFKIFFAESLFIALICVVISIIATAFITAFGNTLTYALMGLIVNIMVFTPLCILMMIGVAVIVAVIGTFFPVYATAKRKPVDAIRSL